MECLIALGALVTLKEIICKYLLLSNFKSMEDERVQPPHAQFEQSLSQRVMALYLTQLGHQPSKVSCQLIDKMLTIIVENPITQPERLLAESGKQEFAERVRFNLHKAFQPQLRALIEDVLKVSVIDLLGESKLQTGRTSVIAVLAATPKVDNPSSIPNVKQQRMSDSGSDG